MIEQLSGALPALTTTTKPGGSHPTAPSEDFASAMVSAGEKVVKDLEAADGAAMSAMRGDADVRQVADAVMNAEQSLQTAIAIRDKIVSAWMEVSRMSI